MVLAQWVSLVLALLIAEPLAWYNIKDLLAEIESGALSEDDRSRDQSRIGYFEARIEQFGGLTKLLWHVAFPIVILVIAYNVFMVFAPSWFA